MHLYKPVLQEEHFIKKILRILSIFFLLKLILNYKDEVNHLDNSLDI